MERVQIFVEGIADEKFLNDYLSFLKINDFKVCPMGGINKLEESIPDFEKNYKMGIKNVLILDSDDSFKDRCDNLKNKPYISNFEISFFLFPNNFENGDLENLLENTINMNNKDIFDCWISYEECLKSKDKDYTTPAKKTKIYAYLEALLKSSKKQKEMIKEAKRDYLNSDHWDLQSEYLLPLKEYLTSI
ncbi:MAG: DUF3226 domain-containing protein [Fluviicola sp.]|jgi:hypothetical protein